MTPDPSQAELLVLALADGAPMAQAAASLRMRSADAVREAKAYGWPDMTAIAHAAADIAASLAPPVEGQHQAQPAPTVTPDGLSEAFAAVVDAVRGIDKASQSDFPLAPPPPEDPMPPRTREPIPLEPDVEAAVSPRSFVLDNTEVPMVGHGLDAALALEADDVPDVTSVQAIDRELMADTGAILRLFDRAEAAPTDRAVLTMPLARLVNADGEETVLIEAIVHVELIRHQVLAVLDGDDELRPFAWAIERQLTPAGETAIRQLATLLPPDADR